MYLNYRYYRGDKSLLIYSTKNIVYFFTTIVKRTCNLYNCSTVSLELQSGRLQGDFVKKKYFEQSKMIFSKRYATDCLSGVFEQHAEKNTIGINDLPVYAGIMASHFELMQQNSFFQIEVNSYANREKSTK